MEFIKNPLRSEIEDWISDNGQYHVVKYPEGKFKFNAYFKPKGWVNFGQSCQLKPSGYPMEYETLEQAQDICEKHFEEYGNNPGQWDRIN
jgi:hypothetical protein